MSKSINQMKAKDLRELVKKGFGTPEICNQFDCTVEEFHDKISKLYQSKRSYNNIIGELTTVDKRNSKRKTTKKFCAVSPAVSLNTLEGAQVAKVSTFEPLPAATENVDALKMLEAALSEEVVNLERTHKNLNQKKMNQNKLQWKLQSEFQKLIISIEDKLMEFKKASEESDKIDSERCAINAKLKEKKNELEKIRQKIRESEKVIICVYRTGEIATMDGSAEVTLVDTGFEEVFKKLLGDSSNLELRVIDLKSIARLLQIIKNGNFSSYEVIFDDAEVEQVFLSI